MDSNEITRKYFDEILIEMRHIDAVIPDTSMDLYGTAFQTPVMMAALSHLKGRNNQGDGMAEMAKGAKIAGAVNWAGMGSNEQFAAIAATGAHTIRIIKPYAHESLVQERDSPGGTTGRIGGGYGFGSQLQRKGGM